MRNKNIFFLLATMALTTSVAFAQDVEKSSPTDVSKTVVVDAHTVNAPSVIAIVPFETSIVYVCNDSAELRTYVAVVPATYIASFPKTTASKWHRYRSGKRTVYYNTSPINFARDKLSC